MYSSKLAELSPSFPGSPFPDRTHNPITGEKKLNILLHNQTLFGICRFHAYKDIIEWFAHSPKMKSFPKWKKAFWMRIMVMIEAMFLESSSMNGIDKVS